MVRAIGVSGTVPGAPSLGFESSTGQSRKAFHHGAVVLHSRSYRKRGIIRVTNSVVGHVHNENLFKATRLVWLRTASTSFIHSCLEAGVPYGCVDVDNYISKESVNRIEKVALSNKSCHFSSKVAEDSEFFEKIASKPTIRISDEDDFGVIENI